MNHKYIKRETFNIGVNVKDAVKSVDQLQIKMSNALKDNNFGLTNYIADRILHSYHARVVAVHRVITNTGARSPGLSEIIPVTNHEYRDLVDRLKYMVDNPKKYHSTPLDRIYILKADGVSKRPLSIPSYIDRCLQSLYHLVLDVYCEHQSDKNSYGFRKLRSPLQAITRAQLSLNSPTHWISTVLEVDIKGCFDNIDHNFLLNNIPMNNIILREWLKCGYVERNTQSIQATYAGVPQGGLISPTLCNMTLNGLEDFLENDLEERLPRIKFIERKAAVLIRFADDMIYLCRSREIAEEALVSIKKFLATRGLEIKESKTRITNLAYQIGTFNFLGANFIRQRNSTVLTKCTKKNYSNTLDKLNTIFRKRPFEMRRIIKQSNPIIRGFLGYYRFLNTSNQKRNLHQAIFKGLGRAAYKHHSERMKSGSQAYRYVKRYYMYSNRKKQNKIKEGESGFTSKWFRHIPYGYSVDEKKTLYLQNPFDFPCKQLQASSKLNYYQISDRTKLRKLSQDLMGNSRRENYLKYHQGTCALCGRDIQADDIVYEIHHVAPRQFLGPDTKTNCVPLCAFPCHVGISKAVARYLSSKDESHISEYESLGLLDIPMKYKKLVQAKDPSLQN